MSMTSHSRATFATRLGGIAAAVGSAVGLGNIWRFPFVTGENGGGAFLLIYIGAVCLLGIPLMIAEFMIGRSSHSNVAGAFRKLVPHSKWYMIGALGVLVAVLILGFYTIIAGWTLEYSWRALTNDFAASVNSALQSNPMADSAKVLEADFNAFTSSPWKPIVLATLFILLNVAILLGGVKKGIERGSNIMMPILFIILLVLAVNSFTLSGASEGLSFLFNVDFSKVTGNTFLLAMGQAFFSLSLGMGCLITYGSYLGDNVKLGKTTISVAVLDTLMAILSGVIIFPACFSYGIQPGAGPGLVFITLPNVFLQMPGGYVWCLLFFLLVALAALTSTISLYEVSTAYLKEEFSMSRRRAVLLSALVTWGLCVVCSLSLGEWSEYTVFGYPIFDFCDLITANYMMPIGALFISLFVGWRLDRAIVRDAITNWQSDNGWYLRPLIMMLRFLAPLCILLIFLSGLGIFG